MRDERETRDNKIIKRITHLYNNYRTVETKYRWSTTITHRRRIKTLKNNNLSLLNNIYYQDEQHTIEHDDTA